MKTTAPFLLSLLMTGALCASAQAQQTRQAQPAPSESTTPAAVSSTPGSSKSTPAAAQATPAQTTPVATDSAALPVSMDRIRKALTSPEPTGPPIRKEVAEDELPRFIVQTEAPRTLTLRSYLDDGTAVPGYVRPAYDPYHYEFLEMVTPDNAKGCAQFSDQGCAQVMSSRIASGLIWQQLLSRGVDNVLRGMFK